MVAEAFLENRNNLPQVNHKNLNKKDNSVENLEWISDLENKRHYSRTSFCKQMHSELSALMKERTKIKLKSNAEYLINGYVHENKTIKELSAITKIGQNKISNFLKENGVQLNAYRYDRPKLKRDKLGKFLKVKV